MGDGKGELRRRRGGAEAYRKWFQSYSNLWPTLPLASRRSDTEREHGAAQVAPRWWLASSAVTSAALGDGVVTTRQCNGNEVRNGLFGSEAKIGSSTFVDGVATTRLCFQL